MSNEVGVILRLKDSLSSPLGEAEGKIRRFTKETESHFRRMSSSMSTWAGIFAGGFLGSKLASFMGKATEAYAEQVKSETLLTNALGYSSAALLDQAKALQQVTTYSDDQVVSVQALLATAIKDETAIKRLTPVILDMAKAKGIDVLKSTDMVTKSMMGSAALSRYGIKVEGAVGSQERLNDLVGKLSTLFHGAAEAIGNTDVGKIERMRNLLNDTQETMGKALLPAQIEWNRLLLAASQSLAWMLNAMDAFAENVDKKSVTDQVNVYAKGVEDLSKKIKQQEDEVTRLQGVQAVRLKEDAKYAENNYEMWELTNIQIAESVNQINRYKSAIAKLNMASGSTGAKYVPPGGEGYLKEGISGTGKAGTKSTDDTAEFASKSYETYLSSMKEYQDLTDEINTSEKEINVDREKMIWDREDRELAAYDARLARMKEEADALQKLSDKEAATNRERLTAQLDFWTSYASMLGNELNKILELNKGHGRKAKTTAYAQTGINQAMAQGGALASIWSSPGGTWQEKLAESITISLALWADFGVELATIANTSFSTGTMWTKGGMARVHKDETILLPKGSSVQTRSAGAPVNVTYNIGSVTAESMPSLRDEMRKTADLTVRALRGGYLPRSVN